VSNDKPSRRRGRPTRSTTFQLVPVRHATPNPRKLGRAFLALAIHRAQSQLDGENIEGGVHDGTS
jgi:hypothetical protein